MDDYLSAQINALDDHIDHRHLASPRVSNALSTHGPLDSPWQLSPAHQALTPSILYQCVACLHRRQGYVYSIAVSRGTVFTGSDSSSIRCWRQPNFVELGSIKVSSGDVRAILAHGNLLFSSHKDNRIRIWSFTKTGRFKVKRHGTLPRRGSFFHLPWPSSNQHKDCISCMAYYEAEGLLYTGSYDRFVKVWRLSDKKCIDSFLAHEAHITAILVNQDDGCVFTSSFDASVKLWRKVYREDSHSLTITLRSQQSPVNSIALSSSLDSTLIYSGLSDGTINFWEKERLSSRYNYGGSLQGHRFSVQCLATVEDLIFSGSEDTTIRVWKREGRSNFHECLAVLDGHRGPVKCMTACLEVEKGMAAILLYSASSDQTLKEWRINVMAEDKCSMGDEDACKLDTDIEITPVLSPSWVHKKTKGGNYPLW